MNRRFRSILIGTLVATSLAACGESGSTAPSTVSSMRFTRQSPAGTVVAVAGVPPGAFIQKGSGQLSVGVQLRSAREVTWAQLYVYLLTADGYCAQNLPDAPTWQPFPAGSTVDYVVTGFQVYQLPCDVTGVHAVLHTRNNGVLVPPAAGEIVVEGFSLVSYLLRP